MQPVLSQSSLKPEVPVLSSPRVNGYVTGGSSGYIPFRGIINQPPSGGKVRIYACYVETCVSEPGVTCGTGSSIVCRTNVPLGKQASRYENVAPIAIPYAWSGKSVNWTMRAFDKKGNVSAWATPKSVTYNWTRRPTVPPTPCGSAGGGTGCSPTGSGGGGVGGGNNEPYTFGWETQIDQRAVTDFQLPACTLNKNISWFLNDPYNSSISPQCTLHTSNRRCVNCHRSSPTAGGYNIQNTATNNRKDDLCRRIPNFLANSSEPQNFKNFFQD